MNQILLKKKKTKNKKYIIVHCSWQKKDKHKYCLKDFMEFKENNSVKLEKSMFKIFRI